MYYYPHHIGDYRRDTSHLSLLEHGIYRQLLDTYYLSEQPLPTDIAVVCRKVSARSEEEKKLVESILNEFFKLTEAGWIQSRCDREIDAYLGKVEVAKENGKLGGRPKKTKGVISGLSGKTEEKANQDPLTNSHYPLKTKSKDLARGTRLPADWFLPDEWATWALMESRSLTRESVLKAAEQFKDYWTAMPGQRGVKLDWCATWRNWIRRLGSSPPARTERFDGLSYVMQQAKVRGEQDEKIIEH
jgi:uncharacterized protein YdaU (DUF1376 family)